MTFLLELTGPERSEIIDALESHSQTTRQPSDLLKCVRKLKRDEGIVLVGEGEMPALTAYTSRRESNVPIAYQNRATQRREAVHVVSDPALVDRVVRGLAMDRVLTSVRDALNCALDDADALGQQIDTVPASLRDLLAALSLSLEDARRALAQITGDAERVTQAEGDAPDQQRLGRGSKAGRHSRTGQ
jgi:hypothetical protein